MNKEGKKLDTIGKRQYSYSTFTLCVANYLAAMGAYQRHLWNNILPLFSDVSEDSRKKAEDIHKEAMALSRQERIAARHVVDASARQATTSIALRRHAWLRSSSLPEDVRLHIEDMPFDGVGLFDVKTDVVLNEHQKVKKMAKSYSSQTTYKPFKQSWRRPFSTQQYRPYQPFRSNTDRGKQSVSSNTSTPRQQCNRRPKQPFRKQERKGRQGF